MKILRPRESFTLLAFQAFVSGKANLWGNQINRRWSLPNAPVLFEMLNRLVNARADRDQFASNVNCSPHV